MLKITLPHTALAVAVISLAAITAQAASEWYFYVQNNTKTKIVKLQVSETKKDWGDFDIGSGIGPGKKERMEWDESTDTEGCDQWIRAKFADGSYSEPSKFNFCKNLDEPIEFDD